MNKVLLIEDEAGIRRTLTLGLMQAGYEVEPCENGITGMARINCYAEQGQALDAVILDMILPDINGLKILALVKEKFPRLPVILITGYGDEAVEAEVKSRKGDAYFEKPVLAEKLDEYLKNLLSQKDAILAEHHKERADKALSRSGYVFIKIKDGVDPFPIYQKLYFSEKVVYCDAVKGNCDIVLLIHGKDNEEMEKFVRDLEKWQGMDEITFAPVEKPVLSSDLSRVIAEMDRFLMENNSQEHSSYNNCSTYAFIEIDPEKFEEVLRQLYFMDNVVHCDTIKGPYQIALLLKGPQFRDIDRFMADRIARIDGILRVTQCNIIRLIEN